MADKVEVDPKVEKQLAALKGATGILHNRIAILEQRNRSLDAQVRKTQHELQQLKAKLADRGL